MREIALENVELTVDRAIEALRCLSRDGVIHTFIRSQPTKKKDKTTTFRYFAYYVEKQDDFQGNIFCSDPLFVIDKFLCKIAGAEYERSDNGVIAPKFQPFNILFDVAKKSGLRFITTSLPSER